MCNVLYCAVVISVGVLVVLLVFECAVGYVTLAMRMMCVNIGYCELCSIGYTADV